MVFQCPLLQLQAFLYGDAPWTLSCEMKLTFFQLLQIYKISDTFSYFRTFFFFYQLLQDYYTEKLQYCFNLIGVSICSSIQEVNTYLTMPYPRLTIMTRIRASERLTAESSSARIKAPWTMRKKIGGKRAVNLGVRKGAILEPEYTSRSLTLFRISTGISSIKKKKLLQFLQVYKLI